MPSVSPKQQRYLFATKGSAWVHEHGFDVLARGVKSHAHKARKKKRHSSH